MLMLTREEVRGTRQLMPMGRKRDEKRREKTRRPSTGRGSLLSPKPTYLKSPPAAEKNIGQTWG